MGDGLTYKQLPTLAAFVDSQGAVVRHFRAFDIVEKFGEGGGYSRLVGTIKIVGAGEVRVAGVARPPTEDEAARIAAEWVGVEWPRAIIARSVDGLKDIVARNSVLFEVWRRGRDGGLALVHERRVKAGTGGGGGKSYHPWVFMSDGVWRSMEPEGPLPFWKPREKRDAARIMIHEGAKAAAAVDAMVNGDDGGHPWIEELKLYEHWGALGGPGALNRCDWDEVVGEGPTEVVYVCDNDAAGRAALKKVSAAYDGSVKGVVFDDSFPSGWDLADPMPKGLMRSGRWVGAGLRAFMKPITRATDMVEVDVGGEGKKKKKMAVLTEAFKEEWLHTVTPEIFIHREWPGKLLGLGEFNSTVAPYSHVDDTARLLRREPGNKAARLHYLPSARGGVFGHDDSGQFINTYAPPAVVAEEGDAGPWTEFLERLIKADADRTEVMRWCATLIARPDVKMQYGMLLISEKQGVGKTTLGEKILAPLVGIENVSFPSESDIVESAFNGWIAHKRLALINEIYAGKSQKAYNKLKSIITDRWLQVNKKHQATYEIECWLHVFACSNSERALRLSLDDRRWFVPKVTDEGQGADYWVKFNRWLTDEGGLGKIKWWADQWLLDNRGVIAGDQAPWSRAKDEIIADNFSPGLEVAAGVLDEIKRRTNGTGAFITDMMVIEHIRNVVHGGRMVEFLEKPATIRKLAAKRGWFVGKEKTAHWSFGRQGRVLATNSEISEVAPEKLKAEGRLPFDLKELVLF